MADTQPTSFVFWLSSGHDGTEPMTLDNLSDLIARMVEIEFGCEMPAIEEHVRHAAFEGTLAAIALADQIHAYNVWYRRLGRTIQAIWNDLGDLAGALVLLILLLLLLAWLNLDQLWRRLHNRRPAAS